MVLRPVLAELMLTEPSRLNKVTQKRCTVRSKRSRVLQPDFTWGIRKGSENESRGLKTISLEKCRIKRSKVNITDGKGWCAASLWSRQGLCLCQVREAAKLTYAKHFHFNAERSAGRYKRLAERRQLQSIMVQLWMLRGDKILLKLKHALLYGCSLNNWGHISGFNNIFNIYSNDFLCCDLWVFLKWLSF